MKPCRRSHVPLFSFDMPGYLVQKGEFKLSFLVLVACLLTIVFFQGCGGGGGDSNNSGAGLGTGFSQAKVSISFVKALNLSKSRVVSDYDLSKYLVEKPATVVSSASFAWDEVLGEQAEELNADLASELKTKALANSKLRLAIAGLREKICQFRVTISAADLIKDVVKSFPERCLDGVAPPDSGVVEVEAGLHRKIRVEGLGLELGDSVPSVLVAAQATLDLSPAITTSLVESSTDNQFKFEEIDVISPVTAIFIENGGSVEGPHRSPVVITLDNFENLIVNYKISEKNNPNSILSAVTTQFLTGVPPIRIDLKEEGIYVFEVFSRDLSGNQELISEKEIEVNFNTNPPRSTLAYSGRPTKVLAGSKLALSIEMQNSQTGTITYQIDSAAQITSRGLKNKEVELIKIGNQNIVPANPIINISFSSKILDGSVELSPNLTAVELTEMIIDGEQKTTFEGASTAVLSSGVVIFCDQDNGSIFKSSQCNDQGKRVMLLSGPFSPGIADEFPCVTIASGVVKVQDEGENGACQGCSTYEAKTGIQCP